MVPRNTFFASISFDLCHFTKIGNVVCTLFSSFVVQVFGVNSSAQIDDVELGDDVYSFSLLLLLQFPKFSPVDQLRVSTLISVPSFDVRLDQTVTLVTLNSLPELQKCVYTGQFDWYPWKLTATKCLQVTFSAQIALAGLHFRDSSRRETFVTDKRYKWPHLHMCHTLTRLMWARLS
jgi:hypothetical protein